MIPPVLPVGGAQKQKEWIDPRELTTRQEFFKGHAKYFSNVWTNMGMCYKGLSRDKTWGSYELAESLRRVAVYRDEDT